METRLLPANNIIIKWTAVNTSDSYGLIYNYENCFASTYFNKLAYTMTWPFYNIMSNLQQNNWKQRKTGTNNTNDNWPNRPQNSSDVFQIPTTLTPPSYPISAVTNLHGTTMWHRLITWITQFPLPAVMPYSTSSLNISHLNIKLVIFTPQPPPPPAIDYPVLEWVEILVISMRKYLHMSAKIEDTFANVKIQTNGILTS